MRMALLWMLLAIGAGVFVAMLLAIWRQGAHRRTPEPTPIVEYVWAVVPWLLVALCVAPSVRRILASE
jgi:heme/copper-type cytochrome/quinol oxidase subunit 2